MGRGTLRRAPAHQPAESGKQRQHGGDGAEIGGGHQRVGLRSPAQAQDQGGRRQQPRQPRAIGVRRASIDPRSSPAAGTVAARAKWKGRGGQRGQQPEACSEHQWFRAIACFERDRQQVGGGARHDRHRERVRCQARQLSPRLPPSQSGLSRFSAPVPESAPRTLKVAMLDCRARRKDATALAIPIPAITNAVRTISVRNSAIRDRNRPAPGAALSRVFDSQPPLGKAVFVRSTNVAGPARVAIR